MQKFDYDVLVTVVKYIANELAEKSGKLSLLVYYDNHDSNDLYQFRMRRSHSFKKYDLRNVLNYFSISDGGGHEGAIGFRFESKNIEDINEFTLNIISTVEKKIVNI